jgi:hypothetical protein
MTQTVLEGKGSGVAEETRRHLGAGERVLWSGQPRQGIFLRGSDALMIPFSLLWGGFALFWEWTAVHSNAPVFFKLWGVPFVLIGVYLVAGRFFIESMQRAKTHYAVTDERILILSGLVGRVAKSLPLRTLSDVSLSERGSGEGTITFGAASAFASIFAPFGGWPGMGSQMGPRFDSIPGAKGVYDVIRNAQRAPSP